MPGMWQIHSDHWVLRHLRPRSQKYLANAVGKAPAYILSRLDSHKYETVSFQVIGVQVKAVTS